MFKKRQYHYWVSYAHSRGFGGITVEHPTKIRGRSDVLKIAQCIERHAGDKGVCPLCWQLLKRA